MKKRIFLGISINQKISQKILQWRDSQVFHARWIPPQNYHVTLVPPWYADDDEIKQLSSKISLAVQTIAPFDIKLGSVIARKVNQKSQMLWITGPEPQELDFLRRKLYQTLNFELISPFVMHVSLAKITSDIKFKPVSVDWIQMIEEIILYQSILTPKGSIYKKLEVFKLLQK